MIGGEDAIVPYGSFDLDDMNEVEKELPTGGGSFFKFKEGKNIIRFIPPRQGEKGTKTWHKHYFSSGDERKAIVCLKAQANEPCDICARGAKLKSSGNRVDAKRARAFFARAYVYANIVDMKHPEAGVQTVQISPGLFKDIRQQIDNSDVGKVFAHPQKGFNIIVSRKGTGQNDTEYKVTVARESSELPDFLNLIKDQPNLENIEQLPSDEEVDEAVEADFEDGKGGKKRRERGDRDDRSSKSKRDEDEDDEEDADFEPI